MVPDVVTVAKGLGGGVPIGAAIAYGADVAALLGAGQHGTTYGGNPLASAAGLAVLHAIERDGLLATTRATGARLRDGVEALGHPVVESVRGEGLLLAISLTRPIGPAVVAQALAAGFIVNAVAPDAVRLAPPLVITSDQADSFVAALPQILDAAVAASDPTTDGH